ncbi:MAG: hypothetical protein ACRYGA_02085 [Janthinobacterium lividum]
MSTNPSSADSAPVNGADERGMFEAHIKTTSWFAVLSAAKDEDDEGASVFRMARMAAQEAWSAGRASLGAAQVPDFQAVIAGIGEKIHREVMASTDQSVTEPFKAWLNETHIAGRNGVGANEAWNAGVVYAQSAGAAQVPAEPTEGEIQSAFEKWLDRVCPSGAVEEVQRKWEASDDYDELFQPQPISAGAAQVPSLSESIEHALWTLTEHNALHFGEQHNTVIQGRKALAALSPQGDAKS